MTKPPPLSAEWSVPADPGHVGVIRRRAAFQVTQWGLAGLAETVGLLLSELLTNAVKAGSGGAMTAHLSCGEHTLEVAVSDTYAGKPQLSSPDPQQEGGRGLLIVTKLAKDWGTKPSAHGPGKTVWCTIAIPPAHTPCRSTTTHASGNSGLPQAVSRLDAAKRPSLAPVLARSAPPPTLCSA